MCNPPNWYQQYFKSTNKHTLQNFGACNYILKQCETGVWKKEIARIQLKYWSHLIFHAWFNLENDTTLETKTVVQKISKSNVESQGSINKIIPFVLICFKELSGTEILCCLFGYFWNARCFSVMQYRSTWPAAIWTQLIFNEYILE